MQKRRRLVIRKKYRENGNLLDARLQKMMDKYSRISNAKNTPQQHAKFFDGMVAGLNHAWKLLFTDDTED